MYKLYFIIAFNLILISAALGQDFSRTLGLADHFQSQDMHAEAASLYRRALYFSNDTNQAAIYPRLAESLFLSGNYAEGDFFYGLAYQHAGNDSLKYHYAIQRTLACIMLTEYDQALQHLYLVEPSFSEYFSLEYHFMYGVISLYKNDYGLAEKHFMEAFRPTQYAAEVKELFDEARLHRPKPALARKLSMMLPGLGQAYAGDTKSALNSFVLNAGLGTLAVYAALNYTFMDGVVSVFPWLVRYYLGGGKNAEATAIQIKQKKINKLILDLMHIKNS